MRRAAIPVVVSCLLPATLSADWVDLKDGTALRGVDYKPGNAEAGKRATFTLETGVTVAIPPEAVTGVRASAPGETVEHDGKQVTLREKVRAMQAAARQREKAAERDLDAWARGEILDPKNARYVREGEAARARFEALERREQQRLFARLACKSSRRSVRYLAAGELARFPDPAAVSALASVVVRDQDAAVREVAMSSLTRIDDQSTGAHLAPYLLGAEHAERVRASQAIEAFPSWRAVPVLIESLRRTWTGFGRAHIFQGTQRSYIKDYNLVSGGTGFSLIEVADPEIGTLDEGVVLDIKIRKVEQEVHVRTLRAITGEVHGSDPAAWAEWWKTRGKDGPPPELAKS